MCIHGCFTMMTVEENISLHSKKASNYKYLSSVDYTKLFELVKRH